MRKLFLCFCIAGFFIRGEARQLELDVFAKNAILINADTGVVLYEKKAREKAYPASITKIASALYVLESEKCSLDDQLRASSDALCTINPKVKVDNNYEDPAYRLETDGTTFSLRPGEVLSMRSLMYALMLGSYNDCANVIAEGVSGSIPLFMNEVNEYLASLGCTNTNFCNPHGLHHPNHYTTAFDMALITKKALSLRPFRQIVSTISYTTLRNGKDREIIQTNRLLKKGRYYYPFAIGVKTGFHSLANYNLVAAAEQNDRRLIVVLMGGEKSESRYIDAKNLFEKAFDQTKEQLVLFKKEKIIEASIEGAKDLVKAEMEDDLIYEYYPAEKEEYGVFIKWDDLKLPINKGDKIGTMELISKNGSRIIVSNDLYSKEKVRKSFFCAVRDFFL